MLSNIFLTPSQSCNAWQFCFIACCKSDVKVWGWCEFSFRAWLKIGWLFLWKQNTLHFCSKLFFWKKGLHVFTCLLRKVSNSKQKIRKSAFGKKHLKLIVADVRSCFSYSVPFLYGDSAGGYMRRFSFRIGKYFKENPYYYTCNVLFFLFPKMLICPSEIFSSTNIMLLGQVFTLKPCFLLSLST